MGYKRPVKLYKIRFEDEPDLEVTAKSLPVGHLLGVMKLADQMTANADPKEMRSLFGVFAKRLVEWNLEEEDGTPVPPVLAQCRESGRDIPAEGRCTEHAEREEPCPVTGLLAQDLDLALRLVLAWIQAVSSVQVPTAAPATGTGTAGMEASIPMVSATGM